MALWNNYELLNSHPNEILSENTLPHSLRLYLLTKDIKLLESIENYIISLKIRQGLYNQYPSDYSPSNPHDLYMSHDQLTTICDFSVLTGKTIHNEIWKEIVDQGFKYDNINPDNPKRYLHPKDIAYIGYINGHKWLYPVFFLTTLFSFLSKEKVRPQLWERIKLWPFKGRLLKIIKNTYYKYAHYKIYEHRKTKEEIVYSYYLKTDGKLLHWQKFQVQNLGFLNRICNNIIEKKYNGWKTIFMEYYNYDTHPIRLKWEGSIEV